MRPLLALCFVLSLSTLSAQIIDADLIEVELQGPSHLDAQNAGLWSLSVRNRSDIPSSDARVRFLFNGAALGPSPRFLSASEGLTCNRQPGESADALECSFALPPSSAGSWNVRVQYDRPFGRFFASADVRLQQIGEESVAVREQGIVAREYRVTHTGDSGPDSLRAVIEQMNVECTNSAPCRITFFMMQAPSDAGWYTIRPLTPLPEIRVVDAVIDGMDRRALEGGPSGFGPRIELDGALVRSGNGLTFRSALATVRLLSVGGFPADGIHANVGYFEVL